MKENEQQEVLTDINDENKEIEKQSFPLISVKRTIFFSASTINHFALSLGLFLFMFMKFNWFSALEDPLTEKFFYYYLLFTGIIQYVIGFYNWYRGRTIAFTLDFILGLFFVMYYYLQFDESLLNFIPSPTTDGDRKGTMYAMLAGMLLVMTIGSIRKGIINLIDILALCLGFVFLFIHYFWNIKWCNKASQYTFVVAACLFWLTGLANLIFDVFHKRIVPLLGPAI